MTKDELIATAVRIDRDTMLISGEFVELKHALNALDAIKAPADELFRIKAELNAIVTRLENIGV